MILHRCTSSQLVVIKIAVAILFSVFSNKIIAQKKDTLQKLDSLRFYKKIKHFAYKYKLTSLLYDATFVDPEQKEYHLQPVSKETKNVNPYLKYQGRIIKEIKVTVFDPFGHSVNDTIERNTNKLERFGNKTHITTRRFVILNKLLFKKDEPINALSLSESERTLRGTVFVSDARIYITESKNKDSVIVNVIVQDKWPILVPILVSDIFVDAKFIHNNLFGVGQQFGQYNRWKKPGEFEFTGYYGIANIDNTYISSNLGYTTDKYGTRVGLSFDRPFFSPLTQWAGGVSVSHWWKDYKYTDTLAAENKKSPLNILGYDVWGGKSFKLNKLSKDRSIFNQSTNIIIGSRFYETKYLNRPSINIDPFQSYYNTTALLGNVGFSFQQYYKDKYIYRFGANEDVPEGLILQFTCGALKQEFKKIRYYTGIEIARAKHLDFGYISATLSYGVFFNAKVSNDVTINYRLAYFSNLLKNGRWLFREFLNFNLVHGENKLTGETINFSGEELYGFENRTLNGNTKMTLNSETVAYLPYQLIGFHFAPVINIGIGMIGSPTHKLLTSNLYQAYTLGVMIRNENLLSNTFQFSIGAYPFFPEDGKFVMKYNPISTFTLKIRIFSISKPEFISY